MAHGGQTAAEAPRKAASPDGPDETASRGFWLERQRPRRGEVTTGIAGSAMAIPGETSAPLLRMLSTRI